MARGIMGRMTSPVPQDSATLNDGHSMPLLGFGTWQITGDEARVRRCSRHWTPATAISTRRRSTATRRRSGAGLAESGSRASDVFITTKVPPRNAGKAKATLDTSLEALRTDHVDLWLIHWPGGDGADVGLWREMLAEREAGRTRVDRGEQLLAATMIDELQRETGVSCPRSTRSSGARCSSTGRCSKGTGSAASSSRATARCAEGRSTTRSSAPSPSATAVRRHR